VLGRALLLMLTCIVVAACGGNSATPTPSPTSSPGATSSDAYPLSSGDAGSPGASGTVVDEAFCGTIANLESALADYEAIKVKPTDGQKLEDQAGAVSKTMDAITTAANQADAALSASLATAVSELVSASEDYATASGPRDTQQKRLKKAVSSVHTAITDLRSSSGCTS